MKIKKIANKVAKIISQGPDSATRTWLNSLLVGMFTMLILVVLGGLASGNEIKIPTMFSQASSKPKLSIDLISPGNYLVTSTAQAKQITITFGNITKTCVFDDNCILEFNPDTTPAGNYTIKATASYFESSIRPVTTTTTINIAGTGAQTELNTTPSQIIPRTSATTSCADAADYRNGGTETQNCLNGQAYIRKDGSYALPKTTTAYGDNISSPSDPECPTGQFQTPLSAGCFQKQDNGSNKYMGPTKSQQDKVDTTGNPCANFTNTYWDGLNNCINMVTGQIAGQSLTPATTYSTPASNTPTNPCGAYGANAYADGLGNCINAITGDTIGHTSNDAGNNYASGVNHNQAGSCPAGTTPLGAGCVDANFNFVSPINGSAGGADDKHLVNSQGYGDGHSFTQSECDAAGDGFLAKIQCKNGEIFKVIPGSYPVHTISGNGGQPASGTTNSSTNNPAGNTPTNPCGAYGANAYADGLGNCINAITGDTIGHTTSDNGTYPTPSRSNINWQDLTQLGNAANNLNGITRQAAQDLLNRLTAAISTGNANLDLSHTDLDLLQTLINDPSVDAATKSAVKNFIDVANQHFKTTPQSDASISTTGKNFKNLSDAVSYCLGKPDPKDAAYCSQQFQLAAQRGWCGGPGQIPCDKAGVQQWITDWNNTLWFLSNGFDAYTNSWNSVPGVPGGAGGSGVDDCSQFPGGAPVCGKTTVHIKNN